MFEVRDNHGFGERVKIGSQKESRLRLKPIKHENENAKRMREKWEKTERK